MPENRGPWIEVWREPGWLIRPWVAYIQTGVLRSAWTREGAIKRVRKAYLQSMEPKPHPRIERVRFDD